MATNPKGPISCNGDETMSEETKSFHIGDVLSITTGRLVSPEHIDGVYKILNWMTRDNLCTHQLPRVSEECEPWLLRWFPELSKAETWQLDQFLEEMQVLRDPPGSAKEAIELWIDAQRCRHGWPATYDIPRIPQDDHERKHPWDELVELRGTDEGIIPLVVPDADSVP
jgi:hypothetical protein